MAEEAESDGGIALGYWVPEEAWAEFEQAKDALAALNDLANHTPESMVINSGRIKSLIDVFHGSLARVHAASKFCRRGPETAGVM